MNLGLRRSILCLVAMSVSALGMAQSAPVPPDAPGYVSLTATQRSDRFFKEYLGSPFTYIAAAGAASGGQIGNDPKEWTRSWEGYGKRVGTTFALFTIDTGVHEVGDAMLGLDPRYFRCRCRGGLQRTWNAVEMSFLAYNSKGRKRFDLPQLAGAYGSGMIVTTWSQALRPIRSRSTYGPPADGIGGRHQPDSRVQPRVEAILWELQTALAYFKS